MDPDDGDDRELYTALCRGGPLDGQSVTSRYPDGFLCVDRPAALAWLYVYDGATFSLAPDEHGQTARPLDDARRLDTADDPRYDVLAAPGQDDA